MYVLAENKNVIKFPYSVGDLRKDNPNKSFPQNPSMEILALCNVFPVFSPELIYNPATQISTQNGCAYNEQTQRWEIVWSVRDKTQEELDAELATAQGNVRAERNKLLSDSDWTQMPDAPLTTEQKTAWQVYRQALRDVTAQVGFPYDVAWPNQPE